jgi:sugar lactone lactonase YvrE
VDGGGVIRALAGTGEDGYGGDGGPATAAVLAGGPVLPGAAGDLLFSDTQNSRVRRVDAGGRIATAAGTGVNSSYGDGGPATAAGVPYPTPLARHPSGGYAVAQAWGSRIRFIDAAGNLYVCDSDAARIRRIDPSGTNSAFPVTRAWGYGGDGGPALAAQFNSPGALAFDAAGNLYVADRYNSVIRRIAPDGTVSTCAGNQALGAGYSGDGG